jgi:N-acetylmuramic acid 6-phosphate etherase
VPGILKLINAEDALVARAVKKELGNVALAVGLVVEALGSGGRLIYVGAGTSGRLGILDASECPPTFGTDPGKIRGVIAGGRKAVFRSQEGAEDRSKEGAAAVRQLRVGRDDVVCGIAASFRTPFVAAALQEAKRRKAGTILITTNPRRSLADRAFGKVKRTADVLIAPDVGPEAIMGSTRLKSGTAQKMILNMITTAAMIRLGKVYGNMMVDLRLNSAKLVERARRVLMLSTGTGYGRAVRLLEAAGGHVKTAIVMETCGMPADRARRLLRRSSGFVHLAIRTGKAGEAGRPRKSRKAGK